MIKIYLKHLILDKFINHLFDGFIDIFHKPVNHYTIHDFPVGKTITTLDTSNKRYEFTGGYVLGNEIIFDKIVINIRYTTVILYMHESKYKITSYISAIFLSDIIGYE